MSMKNSSDTIGNRTRNLSACSAALQPTATSLDTTDTNIITLSHLWNWWIQQILHFLELISVHEMRIYDTTSNKMHNIATNNFISLPCLPSSIAHVVLYDIAWLLSSTTIYYVLVTWNIASHSPPHLYHASWCHQSLLYTNWCTIELL